MAKAAVPRPDLPTGVVTFLLTDVEASTRLWRQHAEAAAIMARQAELIAKAVTEHGGVQPLEQGEGDSTVAAFTLPSAALAAAIDAQRALSAEAWPDGAKLRVRMAVATGEAELRDDHTYGGETIIRCARIRALARGGQLLLSNATAAMMMDRLPLDATLTEVSTCTLDGFDRPERLHQLRHPDLDPTPVSLRSSGTRGLPQWPTSLVGRAREMTQVTELLERARVVMITGAGGSGKTRLAHAVAEALADHFRDGAAWAELAPLTASTQVAAAVATACGAQPVIGAPTEEVLLYYLAGKEMLLVLDNCEHLLDDCAALADSIVRSAPGVTVLATGREPLGTAGEVTWRIPSLDVPGDASDGVAELDRFDAVRLFVERGRAARPDFCLDEHNATLVAHICRRLDGMPLAIELAAARLRTLSLRQLADGLDNRFRLLTGGTRTAMARQRTLLASVEWSYDLLDEQERILFRRLGVFASPFTLEAAEAVAEDDHLDRLVVLDLLAHLVDKSLVLHVGERYRLLETLRQFSLERAGDAGELTRLRDRHLAWLQRRARAWAVSREVATRRVLDEIAAELPDLIAALEWSLGPEREPALDLLYPLGELWSTTHAAIGELPATSAAVLARYEEGSAEWLAALAPVALALFFAGENGWIPAARRALDTIGSGLDPLVRGAVELAVWWRPAYFGRADGLAGIQRAIEDGRAAGSRNLEMVATCTLAVMRADCGDLAAARPLVAWIERHLPGDSWLMNVLEMCRALLALFTGDVEAARRRHAAWLENTGGVAAGNLGLAASIGLWTNDVQLCERAAAAADSVPETGMFVLLRTVPHAMLALLRGDLEDARRRLRSALQMEMVGNLGLWLCYEVAEISLALGDEAAAEAELEKLASHLAGSDIPYTITAADLLRARLEMIRGDRTQAEEHAHTALARAADHDLALLTVRALEILTLLAAQREAAAEAARLLGATEAFRQRAGYIWRYPHHREAIDRLRPQLDPDQLAEGSNLSLAEAVEYARRGRGERGRPSHGWESLTPSEQRVVELVAAGLPNREIAAKLFVSLATVKTHLVHIYAKLALHSRAELAAAATRRALAEQAAAR